MSKWDQLTTRPANRSGADEVPREGPGDEGREPLGLGVDEPEVPGLGVNEPVLEDDDRPAVLDENGIADDELCLDGVGASDDGIVAGIAAHASSPCCIAKQQCTLLSSGRMHRGRWLHRWTVS